MKKLVIVCCFFFLTTGISIAASKKGTSPCRPWKDYDNEYHKMNVRDAEKYAPPPGAKVIYYEEYYHHKDEDNKEPYDPRKEFVRPDKDPDSGDEDW